MNTLPFGYQAPRRAIGYGRMRLMLGISAVGTVVTACMVALLTGLPARIDAAGGSYGTVAMFFVVAAGLHLGFDTLGGYVFPKIVGRRHPDAGRFAFSLARGVAIHTAALVLIGLAMLGATQTVGRWGFGLVGIGAMLLLLLTRPFLAWAMAGVRLRDSTSPDGIRYASSKDEGFTGGVLGVVSVGAVVLPMAWREVLPERLLAVVAQRRRLAATSGAWTRGRVVAIGFTALGQLIAALAVPSGMVGDSGGVIVFSLVFTLWSFAGLLLLPTLSRSASRSLDRAAVSGGARPDELVMAARMLDRLQDDEPRRPGWIERIFHPIPSVTARDAWISSDANRPLRSGAWDVARTSIFLSWSGLGLLSRSVHCNCGRPDLWVFLPLE